MKDRIKKLRKELNLTLENFGKRLGVTKTTVSRIENGKQNLTEQMTLSVCREFGVNEEWLRHGEGEMFVSLTRDEEIAAFIGSVQSVDDDSFKKRLVSTLAKLEESEWEVLEKMAERLQKEGRTSVQP